MSGIEVAQGWLTLIPSMQGAQGKIAEALAPAASEGDKAGKQAGGRFSSGFAGVLGAAAIGVAAAGTAVAGAAVGLYKVGEVFDDVTDTIRVGTGASGAALDGLVASAKAVGTSVPTDFETAGRVVADLNTRLGLSGDTLETVASQYIQAGNILGETVDINTTTAAFSAFGIEGTKVEGAMDTLFQVSQATGVGMNELASTIQTAAAPLQNLGFSFEETAALAGTLDKAGLNTSQVMSSMSKGLVTLAKDGEEPQEAFKRVTGELQNFVSAGDSAGALNLASEVFGTRGAAQFVGALQSGKINLDELTASAGLTGDTILGLGAETADAAESWQLIKNKGLAALEPLGTAVFNLAGNGLGLIAANMDPVIAKLTDFGAGIGGIISILASGEFTGSENLFGFEEDSGFVDFLFNVRDTLSGLGSILGDFWAGLTIPADVADSIGTPLDGFVALGAGVRDIFTALGPALGELLPMISPLGLVFQILQPVLPQVAAAIGTIVEAIVPLVPLVVSVGQQLLAALIPAFVSLVGAIAPLIPVVMNIVSALLPPLLGLFSSLIPVVIGVITGAVIPLINVLVSVLVPVITALLPVISTIFGAIAAVITSVMQIVQGIIQVVTGIISGDWSMVWAGIGNVFSGIWNTIAAVVSGAIAIVGSVIQAGLGLVSSVVSSVLGAIGGFFAGVWNGIVSGTSGMIGSVVGFFTGLPGQILGVLSGAGSWLFDAGKNIVDGLLRGIKSLGSTIGNFFLDLLPGWIVGPFKAALGIHSPSRVFYDLGQDTVQGYLNAVSDSQSNVSKQMADLVAVPDVPTIGASATYVRDPFPRQGGSAGPVFKIYEAENPHSTAVRVARLMEAGI